MLNNLLKVIIKFVSFNVKNKSSQLNDESKKCNKTFTNGNFIIHIKKV